MDEMTTDPVVTWDAATRIKFDQMIAKIPVFLRTVAEKKVAHGAENSAKAESREVVCEKDLVNAFFAETPFGFHGPMKNDMQKIGIDYTKYGHPA